jgi:hypothetical protein
MPLNAKPSCGWPFKPVSVGASPTRGANFAREGDLVDSSPSQGEDSRSVTGHRVPRFANISSDVPGF